MTNWFPDSTAARLFIVVFFIWAASEVINTFGTRLRRQPAGTSQRDQGSYWVMVLTVWGSILVAFLARAMQLGTFRNGVQYGGLGLTIAGIVFREWAVVSLGRFFTVKVMVGADQRLVKCGPYRWLRHPAYTGSILTFVGFAVALGTWVGSVLALLIGGAGFFYRVRIEEKALLEAFGDEYRDYMQHTWRFFPGL